MKNKPAIAMTSFLLAASLIGFSSPAMAEECKIKVTLKDAGGSHEGSFITGIKATFTAGIDFERNDRIETAYTTDVVNKSFHQAGSGSKQAQCKFNGAKRLMSGASKAYWFTAEDLLENNGYYLPTSVVVSFCRYRGGAWVAANAITKSSSAMSCKPGSSKTVKHTITLND